MDVILSPFYPVSDKVDVSHRAGWARYLGKELQAGLLTTGSMARVAEFGRGDTLYLYHGMEWSGAMNLQSGLTPEISARADRLIQARKRGAKLISLDTPMPSYGRLLAQRGYEHGEALDQALKKGSFLRVPTERPKHVIVGDSHALSLYRPGGVIHRTDGQTLHGALERGLLRRLGDWQFETQVELNRLGLLTSYFGNIDVRHHLLRQPDPRLAVRRLVEAYLKQLDEVRAAYKIKHVEVAMPLPIENEARILPKTGYFKGTPFFGSWAERRKIRDYLADRLRSETKKYGFSVYNHPKDYWNKQGELTFDKMETPRSVHIRPSAYRLVYEGCGW